MTGPARGTLRLGIDVGGTNTDAVLMRGRDVVASNKSFTTRDIGSGVIQSVTRLLENANRDAGEIGRVMIGTTQFVNAFVERKDLNPVAAIRIGAPCGDGVPPLVGFPEDLLGRIGRNIFWLEGGADYAGNAHGRVDEQAVLAIAAAIREREIPAAALTATFSPLRPDLEDEVAALLVRGAPGLHVTCSARVGGMGLIDRENAAIMNASMALLSRRVIDALVDAFARLGITVPIYLTQNDGTLITTETAADYPVFTCSAGPTNSIRGAAFLAGVDDAVVVDVGGTTTDIGYVLRGFPRETALPNVIGGVRTNMRMPDILSIPLGGGSIVAIDGDAMEIGPQSVGHRLASDALVFGGETLTTTDLAVRAGLVSIGDAALVERLDDGDVRAAIAAIHARAEAAIDLVRVNGNPIPTILVGGGAILFPRDFAGSAGTLRPAFAEVANAIGAAIATVSGRSDRIYDLEAMAREDALADATRIAGDAARSAGADGDSIELVELVELPLGHMQGRLVRVRARAVGALREIEHA